MDKTPTLFALRWTLTDTASAEEKKLGEMVTLHSDKDRALTFYQTQHSAPPTFTAPTATNPQGEVGLIAIALNREDFGSHRTHFESLLRSTLHWEKEGQVHTVRKFDEHGQLSSSFTQPSFTTALRSADVMYLKTGEVVTPPPAPALPAKKTRRRSPPKPRAGS